MADYTIWQELSYYKAVFHMDEITLCEQCFPGWADHEVLSIVPLGPCTQCGTSDESHKQGTRCHVFRVDPRPPRTAPRATPIDYTALDAAILAQIGASTFRIGRGIVAEQAKAVDPTRPPWRLIERRLQAMRKAGVITYIRADRRWIVVESEPQTGEGEAWPFPTGMFTGV